MPRKSTAERLKTLRDKREQLDAQLRALEARNKQAERRADTRRKVIAGALALEHYEKNPDSQFHRIIFRLLDEYVVRPHDRALFPELVEADADSSRLGADAGSQLTRTGLETGSPSPTP
jgi:chromosome segregation ATPase